MNLKKSVPRTFSAIEQQLCSYPSQRQTQAGQPGLRTNPEFKCFSSRPLNLHFKASSSFLQAIAAPYNLCISRFHALPLHAPRKENACRAEDARLI